MARVSRWTCPYCEREFGRHKQPHTCVPGGTVDASFAGRPSVQREIFAELMVHVNALGPVHVDAVGVGVFLKNDRKLAEIRPMARSLSLALILPHAIDHPRISRTLRASAGRVVSVVKLVQLTDVDDQVKAWLTDAYDAATD